MTSVVNQDTTLYYDYNEDGDLINATGRFRASKVFHYDQNGWIEKVDNYDANSDFKSSIEYKVSFNGDMKLVTTPANLTTTLVHDHLGHVVSQAGNNELPEMAVELPYGRIRVIGDQVCIFVLRKQLIEAIDVTLLPLGLKIAKEIK